MYFTLSLVLTFLPRVGVQLVGSAFCFLPVDISHVFVCFSHFLLIFVSMSEVRFDFCAGLYRAPSTLLVKDSVGEYRLTIGNGLFSSVRRAKGSFVA